MDSITKYILVGAIIGGILPATLHFLKITIFASVADILMHLIGMLFGALLGLIVWRINKK
jgi:membrane associated rhomboid family serine protease